MTVKITKIKESEKKTMIRIRTLREFLWQISEQFGETNAYAWEENGELKTKTYNNLNDDVTAIARELHYRFGEQRHIALIGATSYPWLSSFFGIIASSNVAVPMDINISKEDIIKRLNFADVSVVLLSNKYEHLKEDILNSCRKVDRIFSLERLMTHIHEESEKEFLQIAYPDITSVMLFTSGTTGDGLKAAMITQDGILSSVKGYVPAFRAGDNVLSILPLHHCYELCNGQLKALYNGCTIYLNDSIANIMQNMIKYKIDDIVAVPTVANLLCSFIERESKTKSPQEIYQMIGGSLKRITIGGAATNKKMITLLDSIGISVNDGYGLTESSGGIFYNWNPLENPEAAGIPFATNLEYKISDEGELLLRGTAVMKGYYKQPELTARTIENGWLHTGDLALIKDNGYIVILGRKDNLIKTANGEKVYPEEIEDKTDKIAGVTASMVCAVNNHLACVVFAKDLTEELKQSISAEIDKLNQESPSYMKISEVIFRAAPFPMTSSLKIKRSVAIKELENSRHKEYAAPETPEQEEIMKQVKDILPSMAKFGITDNLYDAGLDSLTTVELSIHLGCSPNTIYECKTIKALAEHLHTKTESAVSVKTVPVNEIIERTSKTHTKMKKNGTVLVTGITGFLGSHLAIELLKKNYRVIGLIRDTAKFNEICEYYGLNKDKVEVVSGDITKPMFGLSETAYAELSSKTDAVFHSAATVAHVGSYEDSGRINVDGTKTVIRFCKDANAQLYHISSFAVTGFRTGNILTENVLDIEQEITQNPYIQTKYQAEECVLKAREEGVPSTIFRIGNLTKRASDGLFQINAETNGMAAQIRALGKLGVYPASMKSAVYDDTSVDKAAQAIVLLSEKQGTNFIWHIMNPNVKSISEVAEVKEISDAAFEETMLHCMDKDVNVFNIYYRFAKDGFNTKFDMTHTVKKLHEIGFDW